ncbi:MAG: sialate O-acetylesterase [Planctomycetota bacterium]
MPSTPSVPVRLALAALWILLWTGETAQASGEVRLPWVFSDHMVLQRDRPIAVWGHAQPGAQVKVRFGKHTAAALADGAGAWRAELPPLAASAVGRELVISSTLAGQRASEIRLADVLVGEVWLCAGQSNMDFPLRQSTGGERALDELPPAGSLRLCNRIAALGGGPRRFTSEQVQSITPNGFYRGTWHLPSRRWVASFSAVGFYFAERLGGDLEVPIGMIDVSVGGSTTEGWVPRERLLEDRALAPLARDFLATPLTHTFIRDRVYEHLADWVEAGRPASRPTHFFEPGFLYDSAIRGLAPFHLRGVLWCQGESNAHDPELADRLFRAMVDSWRQAWGQPALPFHFVQLPGMGRPTWPAFREMQAGWLDIPHTGMVVTMDVGHPTDVHPRNKRPVGERLARVALAETYGAYLPSSGPRPIAVEPRGERLEITFDVAGGPGSGRPAKQAEQTAGGLAWADGREGEGFEVCGADRRFFPASAKIEGLRVILTSPDVPRPVHARYAWAPVPPWGLVNSAGLLAPPFRTGPR